MWRGPQLTNQLNYLWWWISNSGIQGKYSFIAITSEMIVIQNASNT